jgi:hypothetical protein
MSVPPIRRALSRLRHLLRERRVIRELYAYGSCSEHADRYTFSVATIVNICLQHGSTRHAALVLRDLACHAAAYEGLQTGFERVYPALTEALRARKLHSAASLGSLKTRSGSRAKRDSLRLSTALWHLSAQVRGGSLSLVAGRQDGRASLPLNRAFLQAPQVELSLLMARTLSVNLKGPVRSAMVTANGFYDSIVHVELHPGTHQQRMRQMSADFGRRLEGAGAINVAVRQQTAPRNRVFCG